MGRTAGGGETTGSGAGASGRDDEGRGAEGGGNGGPRGGRTAGAGLKLTFHGRNGAGGRLIPPGGAHIPRRGGIIGAPGEYTGRWGGDTSPRSGATASGKGPTSFVGLQAGESRRRVAVWRPGSKLVPGSLRDPVFNTAGKHRGRRWRALRRRGPVESSGVSVEVEPGGRHERRGGAYPLGDPRLAGEQLTA
jgi:hypothetical protein